MNMEYEQFTHVSASPLHTGDRTPQLRGAVAVVVDQTDQDSDAVRDRLLRKCGLIRKYCGLDALPLQFKHADPEEVLSAINLLSLGILAVDTDAISSPALMDVLNRQLSFPVLPFQRTGAGIAAAAAVRNVLRLKQTRLSAARIIVGGIGTAAHGCIRILQEMGVHQIFACCSAGILSPDLYGMTPEQEALAWRTNPLLERGSLQNALQSADVFVCFDYPDTIDETLLTQMGADGVLLSTTPPANHAPHHKNSFLLDGLLAYPGLLRGALLERVSEITLPMQLAAAYALSDQILPKDLSLENLLPPVGDATDQIAAAVQASIRRTRMAEADEE